METFLKANWENIIMANYEVPESILLPYLPNGLELDTYKNKTYVSLVGFLFNKTRIFNIPIPLLGKFEEINLRFYVKRKEENKIKRGIVFINETVPHKSVVWMANFLYNENYSCLPTKHLFKYNLLDKSINYQWKLKNEWQEINTIIESNSNPILPNSFEEFIFEHYYGYAKVDKINTEEYEVVHPTWETNIVKEYSIKCDFKAMYGDNFSFLNTGNPHSVLYTKGSDVSIKWERTKV